MQPTIIPIRHEPINITKKFNIASNTSLALKFLCSEVYPNFSIELHENDYFLTKCFFKLII